MTRFDPVAERLSRPHYVYRCYDRAGRLLYLGCTYNPRKRLAEHRSTSSWFAEVARTELVEYPDGASGFAAEAEAHASEDALHSLNKSVAIPGRLS